MKSESLVIAGQLYSGEFVPGLCTNCPSHPGSMSNFKPQLILKCMRGECGLWPRWSRNKVAVLEGAAGTIKNLHWKRLVKEREPIFTIHLNDESIRLAFTSRLRNIKSKIKVKVKTWSRRLGRWCEEGREYRRNNSGNWNLMLIRKDPNEETLCTG